MKFKKLTWTVCLIAVLSLIAVSCGGSDSSSETGGGGTTATTAAAPATTAASGGGEEATTTTAAAPATTAASGSGEDTTDTTEMATTTTVATTTTAATTARSGEELVLTIGVPGEIQTLDPCCANFIRSHEALSMIYEMPVIHPAIEKNGQMVADNSGLNPRYFESWEAHDDGLTYTIKIREGLTFDDGTPINAEVARFMVERNLETPGGGAWLLNNIAKVTKPPEVIDEYTIRLTADEPSALVMQSFYMTSSSAIDPKLVEKYATAEDPWATEHFKDNVENPSGPYRLVSETPEEIVFEARSNFYLGPPAYDRVIWRVIPDAATRAQLLRAGQIDVAIGLGNEEFAALAGAPGVQVLRAPSTNTAYLGMNNITEPFSDKRLRQAVSHAVNYDDIIENVYNGEARRLYGPIPDGMPTSLGNTIGYLQDLDAARALIAQSSYDGSTIPLYFDAAKSGHEQIAVRVQAALREVEIPVDIQPLTASAFAERRVTEDADNEMTFFVDESLAWIADPNYALSLTLESGVFGNYVDYSNDRVDEIIKEGWRTFDPDARRALFEEAQRLIVDDAPWVFLAQPDYKIAMRESVTGFVLYPNEIPRLADLRPAQ